MSDGSQSANKKYNIADSGIVSANTKTTHVNSRRKIFFLSQNCQAGFFHIERKQMELEPPDGIRM
jgi:hypothetical protein